jgi:hypothetical protein
LHDTSGLEAFLASKASGGAWRPSEGAAYLGNMHRWNPDAEPAEARGAARVWRDRRAGLRDVAARPSSGVAHFRLTPFEHVFLSKHEYKCTK